VVLHGFDQLFHLHPPEIALELPLEHDLGDLADCIEQDGDAGDDQQHGEQASRPRQGMHLHEAHRADRGDGHVEAIQERPVFDRHVARRAEQDQQQERAERRPKLAKRIDGHATVPSAAPAPSAPPFPVKRTNAMAGLREASVMMNWMLENDQPRPAQSFRTRSISSSVTVLISTTLYAMPVIIVDGRFFFNGGGRRPAA
jgi:hypothetical protein